MKWTEEQDDVLRENASLGAKTCRELIANATGAVHTVAAVQRRASRLGLSMERVERCPECGCMRRSLNPDSGLCETCHVHRLSEPYERELAEMKEAYRLIKAGEHPGLAEANRRYDRARQNRSRWARRLKSKCGESVKLSNSLSNARSGDEKTFGKESICKCSSRS